MNVLLATIGTAGDVYPFISIGRELIRRGHRATLIANEYFQASARDAGLEFIQLAPRDRYLSTLQNPDLWNPKKGVQVLADSIFSVMRDTFRIISEFDPSNTHIVSSGLMFGARIAQEKFKFSLTTIHLQPAMFWSYKAPPVMAALSFPPWFPNAAKRPILAMVDRLVLDKMLGERTNTFRAEQSLPKVKHLYSHWLRSPQQVIGLFPSWFAEAQADWPRQTSLVGFTRPLAQPISASSLPTDLLRFIDSGSPPYIFTAGTGMQHGNEFFLESIKACEQLGQKGILVTAYKKQLPTSLPNFIYHREYTSFAELFPRAAAIIHHGGIGTIAQAIAAGVPQVICPTAYDQPDNAARLEKLGLSVTIKPKQYRADLVAQQLLKLNSDFNLRERCSEYAKQIDFDAALSRACDLIEECHGTTSNDT